VVECKGRIVCEEAFSGCETLCKVKPPPASLRSIFPRWKRLAAAAWGMLAVLDGWARDRNIQFKLFSPSAAVVEGLVNNRALLDFEIASFTK